MPKRIESGIALLADPTRRKIIALVAVRALRPSTIASRIGLSRPATSRQLRLLQQAGLVIRRRSVADRRAFLYRVDPAMHGAITAWLAGTAVGMPAELRIDDDGRLHEG